MKNIIKYSIFLALAVGLIWFAFKDIPFADLITQFQKADYKWVFIVIALTFVAHASRAQRWRMLMEPLGYKPSFYNAYLAVWTGYFANYVVPRMGEVTRCGTLQKTDDVPFEKSFGTVVAERVFDVLTLLVLIGINFILEFNRLSQFFTELFSSKLKGGEGGILKWVLLAGVVVGGAAVAYIIFNKQARERLLTIPIAKKIWDFVLGLLDGFLSIRKLKSPAMFIFHTVLIWVMYYFSSYLLFFAVPETSGLSMLAGLTMLVVGAIGMTAPTQGGIGSYHLLVGNVMVLYGLTQKDGVILATFCHATQMLTTLVFGAIAFLLVLFVQKKNA